MRQPARQRLGLLLLALALGSAVRWGQGASSCKFAPTITRPGTHPLPFGSLLQLASADGLKHTDRPLLDANRCDAGACPHDTRAATLHSTL